MKISVLMSTYNQPAWLEKVLWGYACQKYDDFELVIADDGSTDDTQAVIESMRAQMPVPIQHVWHEDQGYRRQTILNVALQRCAGDIIVSTDGDCIPRSDFLQVHARLSQLGRFVSGGYCKLPMALSQALNEDDIRSGRCFGVDWLRAGGLHERSALGKLRARGMWAHLANRLTPTGATWNNCNSSGWKTDLLAVNGFDERMQYGGADRDIGERLIHHGVRPIQARYSAIVLHLDHARGYAKPELIAKNKAIRADNCRQHIAWTEHGIVKGPPASGE